MQDDHQLPPRAFPSKTTDQIKFSSPHPVKPGGDPPYHSIHPSHVLTEVSCPHKVLGNL